MNVLLSSAYWPNLQYMYFVLNAENIIIEQHEHYKKQSYRNRCVILSANGPLQLTIPVKKLKTKQKLWELEISHKENWRANHWRTIQSAYSNSPYFEYFMQDIQFFYDKEFSHLMQYNLEQLKLILKLLRVHKPILLSERFEKTPIEAADMRTLIDPKINFMTDPLFKILLQKKYYQTFDSKFDFVPNLSILDLLFNKGLESLSYLGNVH